MTENIIESTIDEARKRLSESPFWSSFIISWLVMNWKVLYISTSLNSTSIHDKIDAIVKLYPAGFETIGLLIIYPLVTSFIAVAIIPFINHFYLWIKKEFRDWDATIEIKEIQKEKEIIKEKIDLQEKESELENSEQDKWNDEYTKLVKKFPAFSTILTTLIYEYKGDSEIQERDENGYSNVYDAQEIQLLDVHGLIELNENTTRYYHITEKGKYFLKKNSLN